MNKWIKRVKNKIIKYFGILLIIILWELVTRLGLVNTYYLPPFSKIIGTIITLFNEKYLFMNIMVSLWRVLFGLILASIVGTIVGIVLGYYLPGLSKKSVPLFRIFSQLNPYALYPLFVAVFGIHESGKVGIVMWTALWPILFNTITGARTADTFVVKTAQSMGISRIQLFTKVILPYALPSIFQGIRLGIEISFFILIAAEMTGTTVGLGYLVHISGQNYVIDELYAAGLCIIVLSLFLNQSVLWIKDRLYFWKTYYDEAWENQRKVKPLNLKNVLCIVLVIILIFGFGIIEIQNSKQFLVNNVIFEG